MIKEFSCHNFRNIQAEKLEFEKINILLGPNNSGKSNLVKAMTFFSEIRFFKCSIQNWMGSYLKQTGDTGRTYFFFLGN